MVLGLGIFRRDIEGSGFTIPKLRDGPWALHRSVGLDGASYIPHAPKEHD